MISIQENIFVSTVTTFLRYNFCINFFFYYYFLFVDIIQPVVRQHVHKQNKYSVRVASTVIKVSTNIVTTLLIKVIHCFFLFFINISFLIFPY